MSIDYGADAGVEGHAAEIFEPCDPDAFEAAIERTGEELAGLVDGERCIGVGTGDGAERESEVGD